MSARIPILAILISALLAGAALYYLQVYAYYYEVTAEDVGGVQVIGQVNGEPIRLSFENFKGIDSDSSPIRFRACFDIDLAEVDPSAFEAYEDAEPLVAPNWFDCFDAEQIGGDLEAGLAQAYLGVENVTYGIDRIVAIYPDGRAYSWPQINACGEVVFDGNPAPEGCPPAPEGSN
jgi:hypothetical protein